jgi:5-methylcytosine-specific restriction endonuclease McrA
MPFPPVQAPDKTCPACGTIFNRKRYNGTLEDMGRYRTRLFCSQSCANTRTVVVKDTLHWRARKHLGKSCRDCQTTERLHVHHDDRNPENNDPTNLITLCASCHLKLHWREDRASRMEGVRKAQATARARYGGSIRPRSTDGRWSSVA